MNERISEHLLNAQQRLQERYDNSHPFPNRRGWLYQHEDGTKRLRRVPLSRLR
jgi:hypothetical protein